MNYIDPSIMNNCNFEIKCITRKFFSAGFPKNCIRNTTDYFNKGPGTNSSQDLVRFYKIL